MMGVVKHSTSRAGLAMKVLTRVMDMAKDGERKRIIARKRERKGHTKSMRFRICSCKPSN